MSSRLSTTRSNTRKRDLKLTRRADPHPVNNRFPLAVAWNLRTLTYILHLTYSAGGRKVLVNRVWLTPFSAPLESTRSPEVNSHQPRSSNRNDRTSRVYSTLRIETAKDRGVDGIEGWPGIVSRFQLVLLAGRRSKQLLQGALPRIPVDPLRRRNTSIALEELRRGLVPFKGQNGNSSQAIPIDTVGYTTVAAHPSNLDLPKADEVNERS